MSLATALALVTGAVSAEIVIRGDSAALDQAILARLLRLELGEQAEATDVVVDVVSGRANVSLKRGASEPRLGVIELPTAGSGDAERTVALFIAELSRDESVTASPPSPQVEPRPAERATPPASAEEPPSTFTIVAGGASRVIASGGALLFGPFAGAGVNITESIRLGATARYAVASTDVALGRVTAQTVGGGVNATYRFALGHGLTLDTGPSVDLSWIGGSGEGAGSADASGLGVAATWFVEARWSFTRQFLVALALEGGWLGPGLDLRAGDRSVLAVSGGLLGASIGLGFTP